jgi:hypothetical protein
VQNVLCEHEIVFPVEMFECGLSGYEREMDQADTILLY